MQNTKVWLNTNLQTLGTLKPWKSLKPTLSMNSILINWPHLISAKAALKYNFTQLPLDSQKTNWASVSKILRQQQKAEKQFVLSVHHVQHCNDTPALTQIICAGPKLCIWSKRIHVQEVPPCTLCPSSSPEMERWRDHSPLLENAGAELPCVRWVMGRDKGCWGKESLCCRTQEKRDFCVSSEVSVHHKDLESS